MWAWWEPGAGDALPHCPSLSAMNDWLAEADSSDDGEQWEREREARRRTHFTVRAAAAGPVAVHSR